MLKYLNYIKTSHRWSYAKIFFSHFSNLLCHISLLPYNEIINAADSAFMERKPKSFLVVFAALKKKKFSF